jgi:hypothetical protein
MLILKSCIINFNAVQKQNEELHQEITQLRNTLKLCYIAK